MTDQTMATVATEPAPAVPDYLASPDAIVKDEGSVWRYGTPPDYSKTRKAWAETKQMNHAVGSLPQLVENLVKNWEIEASFKPRLQDWRTIDHAVYTFSMNGGSPQPAEHMLRVGTYNAIICPNEYYSPEHTDFAASHKTFKGMMPTFAWEVIEVYSGPPTVVFKWRHWGEMKNDYVAFNDKGEKVTAKAHGGTIEIFGITVAKVDDNIRLQAIDTWMDPLALFGQIAPHGIVNKAPVDHKAERSHKGEIIHENYTADSGHKHIHPTYESAVSQDSPDAVPHTALESTGRAACPALSYVGGDSRVAHSLASNEPTIHHTAHDTVPQGPTSLLTDMEEQGFENVSLADENFFQQTGSLLTDRSTSGTSNEAESSLTEMTAHQRVEEVTSMESAISGAKRPKLGSDALEFHDSAAGIILDSAAALQHQHAQLPYLIDSFPITGDVGDVGQTTSFANNMNEIGTVVKADRSSRHLDSFTQEIHRYPKDVEEAVAPDAGEAVAAPVASEETRQTHQDMSTVTPHEAETMMNQA